MRPVVVALLLAPLGLAACAPTCAQTCNRFYAEDQCDAAPKGLPYEDAYEGCVAQCERALDVPGPAPSPTDTRFDPLRPAPANIPGQDVLQNDQEAAAWMDCVNSFATLEECRLELGKQACSPVF